MCSCVFLSYIFCSMKILALSCHLILNLCPPRWRAGSRHLVTATSTITPPPCQTSHNPISITHQAQRLHISHQNNPHHTLHSPPQTPPTLAHSYTRALRKLPFPPLLTTSSSSSNLVMKVTAMVTRILLLTLLILLNNLRDCM